MKNSTILTACLLISIGGHTQDYPDLEFANEVYLLTKGSPSTVTRMEKNYSERETKVKAAGIGGAESAYEIEGERAGIRVSDGENLSFVFSASASGLMDPISMITLYKADVMKGKRKIFLHKGGYFSTKLKSSEKYSFSVKKIRDGYWELVIDRVLPKGEYAFSSMVMDMGGMDGSVTLFAFGVD